MLPLPSASRSKTASGRSIPIFGAMVRTLSKPVFVEASVQRTEITNSGPSSLLRKSSCIAARTDRSTVES